MSEATVQAPDFATEGDMFVVEELPPRQQDVIVHVDGRQIRVAPGEKAEFMAHQVPNPDHDPSDSQSPEMIMRWRRLP